MKQGWSSYEAVFSQNQTGFSHEDEEFNRSLVFCQCQKFRDQWFLRYETIYNDVLVNVFIPSVFILEELCDIRRPFHNYLKNELIELDEAFF